MLPHQSGGAAVPHVPSGQSSAQLWLMAVSASPEHSRAVKILTVGLCCIRLPAAASCSRPACARIQLGPPEEDKHISGVSFQTLSEQRQFVSEDTLCSLADV